MDTQLRVLVVEDSESDALLSVRELEKSYSTVEHRRVETEASMRKALASGEWDVVLLDYGLPAFDARDAAKLAEQHDPDLPVILVSGTIGEHRAVEMMRAGVRDYVMKDDLTRLAPAVARELLSAGAARDLRRAGRELRESEELFRRRYEHAPYPVFNVEPGGAIVRCNARAGELVGRRPDELVGTHVLDLYADTPDGKELAAAQLERFRRGLNVDGVRLQMQRSDGGLAWVDLSVTAVKDAAGNVVESISVPVDVTERVEAERALRTSEERYRRFFENALAGIGSTRVRDGAQLDMNDALARMLGYRGREETLGERGVFAEQFIDEEARRRVVQAFRESGVLDAMEVPLRRRDGSGVWLSISGQYSADREVFDGVFIDVTERVEAERALRENEERYRDLFENATDFIFTNDLDGRITSVNRAGERVLGYTREELIGRTTVELVRPEHRRSVLDRMAERRSGREPETPALFAFARKDGETVWLDIHGRTVYDRDGGAIGVHVVARDVTDRVADDAALRESEERYRTAVEALAEGFVVYDGEVTILEVNEEAARIMGSTRSELLGRRATTGEIGITWLTPEGEPSDFSALPTVRAFQTGRKNRDEQRGIRRRDGSTLQLRVNATPIASESSDAPDRIVVTYVDITEQFVAERALRESEARYRSAVEALAEGFVIYDSRARIVEINHEGARLLGATRAEFLGKPATRVAVGVTWLTAEGEPADLSTVPTVRALRTRRQSRDELAGIRRPDGSVVHLRVNATPIVSPGSDAPNGVVVTYVDVTEQLEAERLVAEAAAEVSSILDSAQDAIVFADEEGIIRRVNPAVPRMFGWEESELVGQRIGVLTPEPTRSEHDRYVRHYVETGEASTPLGLIFGRTIEAQASKRDGTRFPVELSTAEVERAGGRRGFTAVIRDITERRQSERDRALTQRATVRAEFLSTMSHELRTPLNSVLGFGQLLERQHAGPLNEKQLGQVQDIVGAGKHLLALIEDVLDISKIDAQRWVIEPAPLRPGDVIGETVRGFGDAAAAKAIDLRAVMKDAPAEATLDERALRQVVSNLVENAVKFTDDGRVDVRATEEGGDLVVAVTDTGPGIAEEDHERIFEEFAQVQSGLTREHEGTGLGLAIVKRLIEAHGGSVSVESALGNGSTFTVRLPLEPAAVGARPPQAEAVAER